MLSSGEELVVAFARSNLLLILEPGTEDTKQAMLPGTFKTLLPAEQGHEDFILTVDEGDSPVWSLYTVAAALTGSAPLKQCPIKPRFIGHSPTFSSRGFSPPKTSVASGWFQAGAEFYRFPRLDYCVPEPTASSCIPYNGFEVLGAPEKDRF